MKKILLIWLMLGGTALGADFKAGVARRKITPSLPFWLSGYAARTKPADSVLVDLWAKALAVEDDRGARAVIVTTDLIGLPREVSEATAARVKAQFGLDRQRLLLNSSHTHTGPVVWPGIRVMFNFTPEDARRAELYSQELVENIVGVVGDALRDLSPARIEVGHGSADFAANRRELSKGKVIIGVNPQGPVDHDVPVVKVMGQDGRLRALLFGYACHNTTLGASFYQITGDYAGFTQAELEKSHPGTTAMFMQLCGADQNPNPRGTLELAESHGKELAAAVERALSGKLRPVRPPLRTAYLEASLALAPQERRTFEEEAKVADPFRQRRATLMLKAIDEGRLERSVSCPVQGLRFNNDLTLLALGGEVVVEYALRVKREHPRENIIVAGYSNDVMAYIPAGHMPNEGGYEPVDSMIYYGHPGPFTDNVEESLMETVRQVLRAVGAR